MSESQAYAYTRDRTAPVIMVTLRKNGRWVKEGESMKNGTSFGVGYRQAYHDYSF
jgi:hypothetical protein